VRLSTVVNPLLRSCLRYKKAASRCCSEFVPFAYLSALLYPQEPCVTVTVLLSDAPGSDNAWIALLTATSNTHNFYKPRRPLFFVTSFPKQHSLI
jgi:hypothetical protein